MKNIKKHLLIISIAIAIVPTGGYGMMAACKQKAQALAIQAKELAGRANTELFAKLYKAESVRTAAIRSCMALYCLADGACSSSDLGIIVLAAASAMTALTYNASGEQRSSVLPKKLNLLADGIATIASFDASALPITSSQIETSLRSLIGGLSVAATTVSCLPTSKAELDTYLKMLNQLI